MVLVLVKTFIYYAKSHLICKIHRKKLIFKNSPHVLTPDHLLLISRIREVAEKINKYGPQSPQTLQSLKAPVKQIVIGPAHLGLLLEDGRALRVAFTVLTERLDLSKQEPTKA